MKRLIPAVIAAGATFFVFHFIFEAALFFSALLGIAGFAGAALLFSKNRLEAELEKKLASVNGVTPEMLKEVIVTGRKKAKKMIKLADRIDDADVKKKVQAITDIIEKIYKNFQDDPKDIRAARQFLNYYLDAALKVVNQYVELSGKSSRGEHRESLVKAEELLNKIETAFDKQLTKLYEDDFMDFDTEMQVLELSMKHDGLSKKEN
jgi:5-bromo-4-chloroindolyl phosphate hydrolysis protein